MKELDERIIVKEWEEYNLHEDSQYDIYDLDNVANKHSAVVDKWLELLAVAQTQVSVAKELLQNEESTLFLKAKLGNVPDLGTKPTDSLAKAWVQTQPEIRRAQRKKRKADNNVTFLQNARSVMEHRKSMIKINHEQWVCGYFSRPKGHIVRDMQADEGAKQEVSEKLKESLIKRHKRQPKE